MYLSQNALFYLFIAKFSQKKLLCYHDSISFIIVGWNYSIRKLSLTLSKQSSLAAFRNIALKQHINTHTHPLPPKSYVLKHILDILFIKQLKSKCVTSFSKSGMTVCSTEVSMVLQSWLCSGTACASTEYCASHEAQALTAARDCACLR